MASSLRAGIASLPGSCDGVLITLADQVSVTTFDLKRLATAWKRQPEWLIAATYDGHVGVPAIFPRTSFSAFNDLRGDAGARSILARHADRCLRIPMPNAAIDIDRPEDLLNIAARQGREGEYNASQCHPTDPDKPERPRRSTSRIVLLLDTSNGMIEQPLAPYYMEYVYATLFMSVYDSGDGGSIRCRYRQALQLMAASSH